MEKGKSSSKKVVSKNNSSGKKSIKKGKNKYSKNNYVLIFVIVLIIIVGSIYFAVGNRIDSEVSVEELASYRRVDKTFSIGDKVDILEYIDNSKDIDYLIIDDTSLAIKDDNNIITFLQEGTINVDVVFSSGDTETLEFIVGVPTSNATLNSIKLTTGDVIICPSSQWSVYSTVDKAVKNDTSKRSSVIASSTLIRVVSADYTKNVLKIGTNKYLKYTDYAKKNCSLVFKNYTVNGKHFSLYKQDNKYLKSVSYKARYTNVPKNQILYKSSYPTIGGNGCGPTSVAIVLSGYGYVSTPKTLVSDGKTNYSTAKNIYDYFMGKGFTGSYKNDSKSYYSVSKDIRSYLLNDYQVITKVDNGGKVGGYTTNGYQHWYVILSVKTNSDGSYSYYVADPLTNYGGWYNGKNLTKIMAYVAIKK